MSVYYNEWDKNCCAWLRELMKARLIAEGEIDSRSITDVRPEDLKGFTRCHFFAGIAGWEYALQLAGWPDDRPVWTASCPCQGFSLAGHRKGTKDHRDLWPVFFGIARYRRPATILGEQVEAAIAHGWLDRLCDDLEAEGYAIGAHVLPASSVGAFHARHRLWWVATSDTIGVRSQGERTTAEESWTREQFEGLVQASLRVSVPSGKTGGLVDGIPARMVRLRGYGNAIVPQVAAEFIRAYLDCEVSA